MEADRTIQKELIRENKDWDASVDHPLQSWAWGEFRKKTGVIVERISYREGKTDQRCQLTFHSIPYTPWTIGYAPKGPFPTETLLREVNRVAKQHHAIYVQFEPNIAATHYSPLTSHNPSTTLRASSRLTPSHHPLFTKYTFVLDLTKSESDLLESMHPKTRYNLKVANRHGVIIKEDNSESAFLVYLSLTDQTTARQGFYAHSSSYHRTMWETLHTAGIARLFTATLNGEILTAWIIFCWKDTVYYPYGASSRNHKETMAPTLMLWEIAKWAKNHKFRSFDLWGAIGPHPNPLDPWFGFHRFKQGFNPNLVECIGSYDYVCLAILYTVYCQLDRIRWWFLHLCKRF